MKTTSFSIKQIKGAAQVVALLLLFLAAQALSLTVYAEEAAPNATRMVEMVDYVETIYNESSGMPTSEANTVLQDSKGYIWVGSYGGLSRYNSYEFENMSLHRENAPQSGIRTLYGDSQKRLWIGTNDSGLYVFENESFSQISATQSLSVRALAEGDEGLFVGTTNGLFLLDTEGEITAVLPKRLEGETVESLMIDSSGYLWGITARGQLFALKNGEQAVFLEEEHLGHHVSGSVFQSKEGKIFAGTEGSVVLQLTPAGESYSNESIAVQPLSLGDRETVNDIYQDSQGKLWVCTDNGLGYFNGTDVFYQVYAFPGDAIISEMAEDYEGNLWFASSRRGVFKLTRSKFKNINLETDLANQTVNATLLHKKRLYMGSDVGLFIMDETGSQVKNRLTQLLEGVRIRSFMADSQGNLWICTYKDYGLVCYDPAQDTWETFTPEQGMPHIQVRAAIELANGDIAAATNGGVAILRNKQVVQTYTAKNGVQNETILCLAQGEKGQLFAGSDGNGIYVIDTGSGTIQNVTTAQGLQSGVILRMLPDKQAKGLWVSNGSHLALWQEDGIHPIPEVTAGAGSVLDIKATKDYIWLMKSFGLIRVTRENLVKGTGEYQEISRKDGLTSNITANSWNFLGPEGLLFLSTGNGVYFIDINKIYKNTVTPKIAVGSVNVDGQLYYGGKDIHLPSSAQRVTIHADLLSYGFAEGLLEYCLDGFDKTATLIQSRGENQISYTNLPGGSYTFRLRGYNADGTPSRELTFRVNKELSVWEQQDFYLWAAGAAVLLVLLLVVVLQFINRKRILKRQQEYKNMTDQVIRMVSKTIDAKDKYTIGHSNRVAAYAIEIGRRYGLGEEQLEQLRYTALLHDIGKIGVPDNILNKAGRLTEEEFQTIKKHPATGGDILKDFTIAPWIADGAKYHHERYDGGGYNEGLRGEEIPLYARIISVADAYDSMNSTRIYRPYLTKEVICKELEKGSGTQFDAVFAKIMLQMIADNFTAEGEEEKTERP